MDTTATATTTTTTSALHPLSLPIPGLPASVQAALDEALTALRWVMSHRTERPTAIEAVRRAATTLLNFTGRFLFPPALAKTRAASTAHTSAPTLPHPAPTHPRSTPFPPSSHRASSTLLTRAGTSA